MACISGRVKHVCCSVCLFIVVLALEKHTIPSVLAQEATNKGKNGNALFLMISRDKEKYKYVNGKKLWIFFLFCILKQWSL